MWPVPSPDKKRGGMIMVLLLDQWNKYNTESIELDTGRYAQKGQLPT